MGSGVSSNGQARSPLKHIKSKLSLSPSKLDSRTTASHQPSTRRSPKHTLPDMMVMLDDLDLKLPSLGHRKEQDYASLRSSLQGQSSTKLLKIKTARKIVNPEATLSPLVESKKR
jgi:hypothetical protein